MRAKAAPRPKRARCASDGARNGLVGGSAADPAEQHLLRHRQGVRALRGDRRRRRLADRHRRRAPRGEGAGGRAIAQAFVDRGLSRTGRGQRRGLGPRAHRRGEALPVAHGIAPDRNRRRRDPEGDQRFGEGAFQTARLQRRPPGGDQFPVRRALRRRQSAFDLGRGDRERPCRAPLCRDRRRSRASLARNRGANPGHQHQSDLDGSELDHQEGNHSHECSAIPAI